MKKKWRKWKIKVKIDLQKNQKNQKMEKMEKALYEIKQETS